MAKIEKFEDLEIWNKAREICIDIEILFETTNLGKRYSMKDQMDRSSGSIMDNIAEGFEREGNKEFVLFLYYSKGSAGEIRSQLYRALDLNFITQHDFDLLFKQLILISSQLSLFISYLKKSEFKGNKFKEPTKTYEAALTLENFIVKEK